MHYCLVLGVLQSMLPAVEIPGSVWHIAQVLLHLKVHQLDRKGGRGRGSPYLSGQVPQPPRAAPLGMRGRLGHC